jgi:hypothetical protein
VRQPLAVETVDGDRPVESQRLDVPTRLLDMRGIGVEAVDEKAVAGTARRGVTLTGNSESMPADPAHLGGEPDAFAYASARRFGGLCYVRLDGRGERGGRVLQTVRSWLAAGYDDRRRMRVGRGALAVRGSWGTSWGDSGYGWLSYTHVREPLALDFWTLLDPDWLSSGEFHRP